ncbi:MAG: hypothetical protein ABR946_08035, partial [Solirubrobacteraceae bacterium]
GTAACGTGAQAIVTAGYQAAGDTIYEGELDSPEVTDDLRHVTSSNSLAAAVADGDQAVVRAETHRIVYTRHWHIVRLRVISLSGRVLADVGGPYVLAPVTGQITYHGTLVGRFVMSVQDDLGYEKLVTRFTGLPIELYRNGAPLMGRDFPARQAPDHLLAQGTPITVNGAKFVTLTYPLLAFPTGQIEVMLAIPAASAALAQASCAEVNAQTYGEISVHLAMLINVRDRAGTYVMLDHEFDPDKLTFVRSGSTQLAGSDGLPGPAAIPDAGSISYEGQVWLVYSFLARHSIRVYILFPDATAGATGASGSTGAS